MLSRIGILFIVRRDQHLNSTKLHEQPCLSFGQRLEMELTICIRNKLVIGFTANLTPSKVPPQHEAKVNLPIRLT